MVVSLERETSTGSIMSTTSSYASLRTSSVDLKRGEADANLLKSVIILSRRASDASIASSNGGGRRHRRKTRPQPHFVDSQPYYCSKGMYMKEYYRFTRESFSEKALRRISSTSTDLLLSRPKTLQTMTNRWGVESVREIRRRKRKEEEKKSGIIRKFKKACCAIFSCFSCKH